MHAIQVATSTTSHLTPKRDRKLRWPVGGIVDLLPYALSIVALPVASLFAVWVPRRDLVARQRGATHAIVRWGHSATWLLIAAWAILLGLGIDSPLAAIALVAYLAYVVSLLRMR